MCPPSPVNTSPYRGARYRFRGSITRDLAGFFHGCVIDTVDGCKKKEKKLQGYAS